MSTNNPKIGRVVNYMDCDNIDQVHVSSST